MATTWAVLRKKSTRKKGKKSFHFAESYPDTYTLWDTYLYYSYNEQGTVKRVQDWK